MKPLVFTALFPFCGLAALQGMPTLVDGAPLKLAGSSSIAQRMLVALVEAHLGAFSLSSGAVWVQPEVHAQ